MAIAAVDEGLQLYDKALADGWGDLDIAAVHDVLSGQDPASAEPGSAS